MAFLGVPYRVVYAAKNFTAGVTPINARVIKPNNAVVGVFSLLALPSFPGFYYFDLLTVTGDPEGEWICVVESPTEGVKDVTRISFSNKVTEELADVPRFGQTVTMAVKGQKLQAKVEGGGVIAAMIQETKTVNATSARGEVKALLKTNNEIQGETS